MKIKIEKRMTPSTSSSLLAGVLSFVLAIVVCGFMLAIFRVSPLKTYSSMARSAFGSWYGFSEVLVKAIPLTLCGLAVGLAFQRGFFSVGIEGQLAMGGIAASWVALFLPSFWPTIPGWACLAIAAGAGFFAGGFFALIPAVLRERCDCNEILTGLMLNPVAVLVVEYLYYGPWKDPKGYGFPGTAEFPSFAWLPRLSGTRIHLGLAVSLVAAVLLWFVIRRTTWGFEVRVIGANPHAARFAGMNLSANLMQVATISGGLAGLAGMVEVCGIAHRLTKGLTVGYGITAITVALLAQKHPLVTVATAILLSGLAVGGDQIQISMGLPASVAGILQGMILFFLVGGEILKKYQIAVVRSKQ